MKTRWKNWIIILTLVAALFTIVNSFYGWFTPEKGIEPEDIKPGYVCADGTVVSVPENCLRCDEDKICQETEECTCEDCKYQVRCIVQRVEEGEHLMLLNNPKKIGGKDVVVKEITPNGVVIINVGGVVQEIETTKQEKTTNGLKITTQEIIYHYLKPEASMVIIKAEKV